MDIRRVTFTIAEDPPPRLDKALARDVPEDAVLSRTRLARLIADGAVHVDGVIADDPKARVAQGASISIVVDAPQDSHIAPEPIPLDVVFEDDDLIVINKPAGMVVHPAPGSRAGTLVNALLAHCGDDLSGVGGMKRPGIVHRIDKETSGLLVVAKSDRCASRVGRSVREAQRGARITTQSSTAFPMPMIRVCAGSGAQALSQAISCA